MLCERCKKNEATVSYREIMNGKEKKYLLCEDCAKEMEKNGEISFSAPKLFGQNESAFASKFFGENESSLLNSMFGSLFAPARGERALSEAKKCPLCGATFGELVKEGKVGCAKCYDAFAAELERTVSGIHGQSVHSGKSPAKLGGRLDVKQKIRSLERELKDAIKDERYERAAELRDEINTLRAQ